ncbi:ankyrin repeat-containing domain protein [Aspergillus pseudoustus]|uniref:Ankyrin repeat-containing domain protein n=1 Tax=Aspergillus pseudoustus TaxID=1810923 RepID=A0ABR4K661_9EURO
MSAAPNNNRPRCRPFSFWDRAYDMLRRDNPQLVEEYEMLLSSDLRMTVRSYSTDNHTQQGIATDASGIREAAFSEAHEAQLNTIIERRLQQMLATKTLYTTAGYDFVLKERIPQAAQLALWAKDWISQGVDYYPEAEIIWAGICIALPFLTSQEIADEANRTGFTYVAGRMHYFAYLEVLLLKLGHEAGFGPDVLISAYRDIVSLYRSILHFQIQSIVHFQYTTLGIAKEGSLRSRAWEDMLDNIAEYEDALVQKLRQIPASISGIKQRLADDDLRWMDGRYEKGIETFQTMRRLLSADDAYVWALEKQPQDHKESTLHNPPGETKLWRPTDHTVEGNCTQLLEGSGTLCLHESKNTASIPCDKLSCLLLKAIKAGQEADVKLLLDGGADIENKDGMHGQTPLFLAVREGHLGIVKLLVDRGAEVKAEDGMDQTVLACAVEAGHEAIVGFLLSKGADIETEDYEPLFSAAGNGQEAVVNLLLSRGADINSRDSCGQTPLMWAVKCGEDALVKLLLSKGADLEMRDPWGKTPLLYAATAHRGIAKILIERGANLNVKDKPGQSALLLAAMRYQFGPTWRLLYHAKHLADVDIII